VGGGGCVGCVSGAARTDVWFTESGTDYISRLVYTGTGEYRLEAYALAAGSEPLNVAVGADGMVWFTEAGRNRIGRLDPATGDVAEFLVPTADSRPADLALAPDGSVWFTEMRADQIARLVVTSTVDYRVVEYADASLVGGRPYGIVVSEGSVYVAQTANDRVSRFTPPDDWVWLPSSGMPSIDEPYALTLDETGGVWGVERAGNRINYYEFGTLPITRSFDLDPPNSMPIDIAAGPGTVLWASQWAAGQIVRLVPSVPVVRAYYGLPESDLAPTGIAVGEQGEVWVLATRPTRVYMPFVARNG